MQYMGKSHFQERITADIIGDAFALIIDNQHGVARFDFFKIISDKIVVHFILH